MELSVFSIAAVFLSSLVAAMGLGGGTVLLLYLSFFSTLSQPQMQSLNLLLFLPAADMHPKALPLHSSTLYHNCSD